MPRFSRTFAFSHSIALAMLCNACGYARVGTLSGAGVDTIDSGIDATPEATDSGIDAAPEATDSGVDSAVVGCPCDPRDEAAAVLGADPTDPGDDPTDCSADLEVSGAARACVMNALAAQHSFVLTQEVHDFDASIITVLFGTHDGRVFSSSLYLFQRPDLGLCNPIQLQQCGTFTIMDEPTWTMRIYTCDGAATLNPMCQQ